MNSIYVIYGDEPQKMIKTILKKMKIEEKIKAINKENPHIGIKPNLVVPQPASWGATTSPELVRGIIEYLQDNKFNNITILESSWVGDNTKEAFSVCGYEELKKDLNVSLVDLKDDASEDFKIGETTISVCKKALEVDYLINVPVLKAHCQTKLTCALKNLKGCIPDKEKRRFHALGLHYPIALLNKILKADLIIVDGIIGDLTHEEGGTPVQMNRLIGGYDPVLIDTYAAELIGYSAEDIEYIIHSKNLQIGSTDLDSAKIIELNSDKKPLTNIMASRDVDFLQKWITEEKACSACYGSLLHALKRLNEKGKLHILPQNIFIGQGFKGENLNGIGVGVCTNKCKFNIPGCPPNAKKILTYLEKYLENKE